MTRLLQVQVPTRTHRLLTIIHSDCAFLAEFHQSAMRVVRLLIVAIAIVQARIPQRR